MIDTIIQFITKYDDLITAATNIVAAITLTALFLLGLRAKRTIDKYSFSLYILYTGVLVQTFGWALQRWFYAIYRVAKSANNNSYTEFMINAGEYTQVFTWMAIIGVLMSISPFVFVYGGKTPKETVLRSMVILFFGAVVFFFVVLFSLIFFVHGGLK